jgi:ribosomal protein L16 Arg81 hydroxylase
MGALPTFQDLLQPHSTQDFLHDYWERQPLWIRRGNDSHYGHLLDRTDLRRLLAFTWVNRRDARIVKNGQSDPALAIFDGEGRASPVALMAAYVEGHTVVVNNLQTRHQATSCLCRSLEVFFRQPVGANAYLTPARAAGLAPHFDDHDAFVLQLEGSKEWRLYDFCAEQPLRGRHFDVPASALGEPSLVLRLAPGDLLYLPRGLVHEAHSTDTSSLHLTLGVSSVHWMDLLREAIANRALAELPLRRTLPPLSTDYRTWRNDVLCRARDLATGDLSAFLSNALNRLEIEFISTLAPLDDNGFEQLDALDRTTMDSRFRHRIGTVCCVESGPLESRIHFPGNAVSFPPRALEVVEFIASHDRFATRDLPDVIDDPSKLNVVRKMVMTGLLVPDGDR